MKKALACFVIFIFLFSTPVVYAQSWNPVGSVGFTPGVSISPSIAIDLNGTPYVVYLDDSPSNSNLTVMKYNGTTWVGVGGGVISTAAGSSPAIAIDDSGAPYVVYMEGYSGSVGTTVKKFDGSNWVTIGSPGFSGGTVVYPSIAIWNGIPYVAYQDTNGGKATVMKFDGISWATVGDPGFSASAAGIPSIAIWGGVPYVAYMDYSNNQKVTVMKFNGSSWIAVGGLGFSVGQGAGINRWIAINHIGTPYVAYTDGGNGNKATVMKFNGSSWVTVGSPGFTAGMASYTTIAIDSIGTPYIAYEDFDKYQKATVMKYDGSNWVIVGNPGFSDSSVVWTSIAINKIGTPYVVYADNSTTDKATVMKFGPGVEVKNICDLATTSLTIFPDPNNGSFTLNISTSPNLSKGEECTIIITNMLGEKVKELTATTNTDKQIQLDAPPGIYFISAVTTQGKQSGKVMMW